MSRTESPETILSRFAIVLWTGTLVMIGLSLPLWYGSGEFPRVPAIRWDSEGASLLQRRLWVGGFFLLGLGSIGFATVGLLKRNSTSFFEGVRVGTTAPIVLLLWGILADQERFQPWVYQFLLSMIALGLRPTRLGLRFCRLIILAIYFYSGLSKLDVSFSREIGPTFLNALLEPIGLVPSSWPRRPHTAAILAMPLFESGTAVLLSFRRTRFVGCCCSTLLHLGLIAILGPWNLNQSTIVLVWNTSMALEVWALFGREPETEEEPEEKRFQPGVPILHAALLVPLLEPAGLFDPWPAHALYASHIERVVIEVPTEALEVLPTAARLTARPTDRPGWTRLDPTAWSRLLRGVPVYPGRRANLAIAEWIARQTEGVGPTRVILQGRADRFSGSRTVEELLGLDSIQRRRASDPTSVSARATVPK